MTTAPIMRIAAEADMLTGGFGKYLALNEDNTVATRVLSCEDFAGDVYGETPRCTSDWRGTAALVVMAWENAVDVVYVVTDEDRGIAWTVARKMDGYTGITNEFYEDGQGWTVVCFRALGQA